MEGLGFSAISAGFLRKVVPCHAPVGSEHCSVIIKSSANTDGSMWGVVTGILGISVILALAETLYKEVQNRPGPPEKLEGRDYVPPSGRRSQYSGPAKDVLNQAKKLRK